MRHSISLKLCKKALLLSLLSGTIFTSCKKDSAPAQVVKSDLQVNAGTDPSISDVTMESHLVGFWKFDGNPNDASGNGNNGKIKRGHVYFGAGLPALTSDRFGRPNKCYHFDKGGNIQVPYTKNLNPKQMTISLWVKWSSAGRTVNTDTYTFLSMNRWFGYKFQLQSGHLPFYTVMAVRSPGDTTIYDRDDAGVAVAENTWSYVAVTFTSGTMAFYLNGDLVKIYDATTPDPVPGTALTLLSPIDFVIGQDLPTDKYVTVDDGTGRFFVNWGGFFTGDMDDVMFFNAALTAQQVKSVFTRQSHL